MSNNIPLMTLSGYFVKTNWEDALSGKAYIKFATYMPLPLNQNLFFGEKLERIHVGLDTYTSVSEKYVSGDATVYGLPRYLKDMPLYLDGYFDVEKETDYSYPFIIMHVRTAPGTESKMVDFLANFLRRTDSQKVVELIREFSHDGAYEKYFGSSVVKEAPENTKAKKEKLKGFFKGSKSKSAKSKKHFISRWQDHGEMIDVFKFAFRNDMLKTPAEVIYSLIPSVSAADAEKLIETLQHIAIETELFEWLVSVGGNPIACSKAVQMFGTKAKEKISEAPYVVGKEIGLSFKACDNIAKELNIPSTSIERYRAVLEESSDRLTSGGSDWLTFKEFCNLFGRISKSGAYKVELSCSEQYPAIAGKLGCHIDDDGKIMVYNVPLVKAEYRIAENIKRLAAAGSRQDNKYENTLIKYAESVCDTHFGNQQKQAFPSILSRRGVKILTGGPGTGKTTTMKGIIEAYERMHPEGKVCLCAPTGRAAQRLSESTGRPATTIHRLLEYAPGESSDECSCRDSSNPLDTDFLVVDEMSMTDIHIFDLLLEAVKSGSTVVLVGDPNQLESVGAGAILRDLLNTDESLVQKAVLTEVFRQKGGSPITENAIRTQEGNVNLETCDDFQIIKTKSPAETLSTVKKLMNELYDSEHPFDTQILCPIRKGDAGVNNSNREMQAILNPSRGSSCEIKYGRTVFRVGDKIIMTKNNPEHGYFNGDVGTIVVIEKGNLYVNIAGETIEITRDIMKDVQLAYSMTIHKSQGSEFSNVIMALPVEQKSMLVRNLFYTGITRAKKRIFIVSEGNAMETSICTDKSDYRKTMLGAFLTSDISLIELEKES